MKRYPIKRWSLFDEIERAVDDAFSQGVVPTLRGMEAIKMPRTDMKETKKEVIFTAEIPGVEKDNIKVNITKDTIDVSVESKEEEEKKTETKYRYKSRYEGFASSYRTPADINPDNAKAAYKNGVLMVKALKAEVVEGKRVEVE